MSNTQKGIAPDARFIPAYHCTLRDGPADMGWIINEPSADSLLDRAGDELRKLHGLLALLRASMDGDVISHPVETLMWAFIALEDQAECAVAYQMAARAQIEPDLLRLRQMKREVRS